MLPHMQILNKFGGNCQTYLEIYHCQTYLETYVQMEDEALSPSEGSHALLSTYYYRNEFVALQKRKPAIISETDIGGEIFPRSRLFCLTPLGMGTLQVECLTSYIHRLAWTYCVNPRILVAQEILPQLGNSYTGSQLATFSRGMAIKW